jgi:hypothetical protein
MTLTDVLTISAIVIGPIAAVQIEKYLERLRDQKNRRLNIFKTLMATRGAVLSPSHVEALNRIDLEFSKGKKYEKVNNAWKEYLDNLGQKADTDEKLMIWGSKNEELLANLLYEMGKSLNYTFDKVLIKRNIYSPVGQVRMEKEFELIRQGLIDVLQGKSDLPININNYTINEDVSQKQRQLQDLMIKYYDKKIQEDSK